MLTKLEIEKKKKRFIIASEVYKDWCSYKVWNQDGLSFEKWLQENIDERKYR